MNTYFRTCHACGAALDPEEICTCMRKDAVPVAPDTTPHAASEMPATPDNTYDTTGHVDLSITKATPDRATT